MNVLSVIGDWFTPAHLATTLAYFSAICAVLSFVNKWIAPRFPKVGAVIATILHVSPGNVAAAFDEIAKLAALIRKIGPAAGVLVVLGFGMTVAGSASCKGGSVTPSNPSPRTIATASAVALERAWIDGANGCRAVAVAQNDDAVRAKCAAVFVPAQSQIIAIGAAVDAWSDTSQSNFACLASDGVTFTTQEIVLLQSLGVKVPDIVKPAVQIAGALAGECTRPTSGKIGDPFTVVLALLTLTPQVVQDVKGIIDEFKQPSPAPLAVQFAQDTAPVLLLLDTPLGSH